jgi:hypothetical protein
VRGLKRVMNIAKNLKKPLIEPARVLMSVDEAIIENRIINTKHAPAQ